MESSFRAVSFADSDAFAEWQIALGWDVQSTQLTYGPQEICFDHFELPGMVAVHFRLAQSQYDVWEPPQGTVLFLICRAKLPVVWNGTIVPPSQLAVVRAGMNHSAKLPAGWDCYEFIVEEELIRRTELFPPEFFEKTARVEDARLPLPEPQTARFLDRMDGYFRLARKADRERAQSVDGAEFSDFVLHGLREVIDAGLTGAGTPPSRRVRGANLVPDARDFMEANLRENLTADQIAQSLGVSYRALHYAFRESLGVSPYRYYLTRRLHSVRKQLKSGTALVTEASLAGGFFHPSRFTRQYKRLFGELPSETRNGD